MNECTCKLPHKIIVFKQKKSLNALQDDEDGHLVVLTIIEELMTKKQEEFLDHFARLGVFSKVQALMGNNMESDLDVIKSQDDSEGGKGKNYN